MQPPRRVVEFLQSMFERSEHPYEGADLDASRRIVAAVLALTVLLSLAFLPLEPVDDEIGWPGWLVAATLILIAAAGAVAVARRRPTFDQLHLIAYLGVAGVAVLNWLAGGGSSAFEDLYVLWLAAGAVHPPRRAFTHLAVMLGALALPLAYEGTGREIVTDMIAEALILIALGSILVSYLYHARRQRVGLQSGAEVARRLARVDAPTGLGNRRAFDEVLTVEVARAAREGLPLTVGLVDIDGLRARERGLGPPGGRPLPARGGARDGALGAWDRSLLPLGRGRVRDRALGQQPRGGGRRARPHGGQRPRDVQGAGRPRHRAHLGSGRDPGWNQPGGRARPGRRGAARSARPRSGANDPTGVASTRPSGRRSRPASSRPRGGRPPGRQPGGSRA